MSCRLFSRAAILIPILLLLFRQADAVPAPVPAPAPAPAPAPKPAPAPLFGLLGNALGGGNTTSLIAALALAHIEHTIDKLNALANAASTLLQ